MRKVCLLGTAPLSRDIAPYDDNDYDIWVCSAGNMLNPAVKRVTEWFELHALVELEASENRPWAANYMKWLREQTFPVWMLEKNDLVPQARIFPGQELLEEFGREWFTSSIAWMQAKAIHDKYEEIAIFGVDMAADMEHYTGQRMGCRRFIEIAKERGIKTTIPWESCLGNPPPVYGYGEATPMGRRINVTESMLVQKRGEIDATARRMELERAFFDGAIEQLRYFKRTFVNGVDAFDHMSDTIDAAAKAAIDKIARPAPSFSQYMNLPEGSAIAPSGAANLTPPPPVEEAAKGNGSVQPYVRPRAARKTSVRPSEGQEEAI